MHGQGSGTGGRTTPTGRRGGSASSAGGLDEDEQHELAELLGGLVRRSGRHLAADLPPLEVECWASRYWELCCGQELLGADPREVFGGGTIVQAAAQRSPEALAVLRALATVAPFPYGERAAAGAEVLAAAGVDEPAWSALAGRARATEAWCRHDPIDDDSMSVLVAFDAPGSQTVSVEIDHNLGGLARHATVVAIPIGEVLRGLQRHDGAARRCHHRIDLDEAAARWRGAFERLQATADAPVSGAVRELQALVLARLRALPPAGAVPPRAVPDGRARQHLVEAFLDTDEARALAAAVGAPTSAIGPLAREILDFGLDRVVGTPLRFSPAMVEAFLRNRTPRSPGMDVSSLALVPSVLAAWIRFAGRCRGLPEASLAAALRPVAEPPDLGSPAWSPRSRRDPDPRPSSPVMFGRSVRHAAASEDVTRELLDPVHAPGSADSLVGQAP